MRRDPKRVIIAILGVLGVANLVALGLFLFPVGGSPQELERQRIGLEADLAARRVSLERTRQHVGAVEKGRSEGDQFVDGYFLPSRTLYSTLLSELIAAANEAKITPKDQAFASEPVEGSNTLSMVVITATYEGTYENLMHFVHEIDQSPRLLIINSLVAAPQQGTGKLTAAFKLETFMRETEGLD